MTTNLLQKLLDNGILQYGIWETIYMTLLSTIFAYVIGLPIGLILSVTGKNGIRPIAWLNRILGNKAMIVTLVIAAAPYVARMVESSIAEVGGGVIEAAKAMGTPTFKIVTKVLIPEARPSLITGSIISMVTILGYSAMAGTIGGGGLGQIAITYGYPKYQNNIIWICVALTIIIVQIIQELGAVIARRSDRRINK